MQKKMNMEKTKTYFQCKLKRSTSTFIYWRMRCASGKMHTNNGIIVDTVCNVHAIQNCRYVNAKVLPLQVSASACVCMCQVNFREFLHLFVIVWRLLKPFHWHHLIYIKMLFNSRRW